MAASSIKYRLGLDMGTNSIGWAAVKLGKDGEPVGVLDMGVRIFPDGRNEQSKQSNAVDRRVARGQRRRRDRYLQRRRDLMQALIEYGLMPEDAAERKCLEKQDPYELRARALDEPLQPYQLGRALFHLNQRRGFKSNRKAEKDDSNTGPAKKAAKKLDERMSASNARTLGEFLYPRQQVHDSVRFRNLSTGNKAEYEFYPTRQMILDEFDKIWAEQAPHHANVMTAEAKDTLRKIISYQRPIESPPVGKCTLDPASDNKDAEGFRCSWAHPLAQRFRIWQEVRNLEAQETGRNSRPLSKEEGDAIAAALLKFNKVSFDGIRRLLHLPSEVHFNLESEKRKELAGDETAAKLSGKKFFGETWRGLPPEKQIEIVDHLLNEPDENATIEWLVKNARINRETAEVVASAFLPEGHCRLGVRAIRNMLPYMKNGMDYYEAATAAGYDPARAPKGELSPDGFLPYYGEWLKDHLAGSGDPQDPVDKRYGRYPNPTIHVALGQLRRVVNTLITEYGPPHQVVIEVTRDLKQSKKQREEIAKEQAANQKKNDDRNKKLTQLGQQSNSRNRLKLRLWEELNPKNPCDRRCPFTGEIISMARLFSDANQVEIEHLIPFSYSYDDSAANKVVALTRANRQKGKCTPFEAFGQTPEWEDIIQRAAKLPHNKRWRFSEDARRRFDEQDGFLARQLNETGWLARMTKGYLTAVVSPNNIWVSPGRLTDIIRAKWGLKTLLPDPPPGEIKNRNDHRHHAIDAFVVALTDRSLLQRMSSAYDETRSRIRVPEPWESFDRNQLKPFLDKLVVSYKPDHGTRGVKGQTTGQLHNETAYGLIKLADDGPSEVVVRRQLSMFKNRKSLEAVRDPELRGALQNLWDEVGGKSADFAEGAAKEGVRINGHNQRVRRVRVVEQQSVIPVKDSAGKYYKGYLPGGNELAEVWEMPDKRKSWRMEVVSIFDANQPNFNPKRPHPAAKRLMRLQIDDMGTLGEGG